MVAVVIDTNVLISRLVSPEGSPAMVFRHFATGTFELLVSAQILEEYERVLERPKFTDTLGIKSDEIRTVLAAVKQAANWVIPEIVIDAVTDDPDDNIFIEAAVAGGADFIVSGDRHLLALGSYEGIRILTPALFIAYLDQVLDR